jgi:hypothetical protein
MSRALSGVQWEDAVLVGFAECAVAGVKVFGDGFYGENADACRECAVESAMKICGRDGGRQGEGGDLGKGVDASVRATGALGENGFSGDAMDGLGECALNGWKGGLNLPAVIGCSIVGENDLPVRHGDDWDGITWLLKIAWHRFEQAFEDSYDRTVASSGGEHDLMTGLMPPETIEG